MWCVSISTPVLSHVIYGLWGKQHTYVSLKCILCASVRALIFSIKWFEIFWFEYLLLMRDYHYHGLSMHLFSCIHKCKCNAHSHMYGKTIFSFFIKAICNLFPFKFIAIVVVHAILQWFICAKADRDMLCAGLSGAVCLCACMCECVCVCVRARARVSAARDVHALHHCSGDPIVVKSHH